jgi:hypothetical protein
MPEKTARANCSKFSPALGPSWYSCFIQSFYLSRDMDEPERHSESKNDADGEEQRLFPEGFFDISRRINSRQKQYEKESETEKFRHHQKRKRSLKEKTYFVYLRWWGRLPRDRRIEFIFALAIVYFSWAQWHTARMNNDATAQQTDQLIAAAKYGAYASERNALAAQSFAESARKINGGINNAVDRLNSQAQATSDVAHAGATQANAALATANNTSQQIVEAQQANTIAQQALDDQTRPWVGIVGDIEPIPDTQNVDKNRATQSIDVRFKMENYGGSVATQVAPAFALYTAGKPNAFQFNTTKVCETSDRRSLSPDWLRGLMSIFPKQISDDRQETASCTGNLCRPPRHLAVCITYQRNQTTYHTQLLYEIESSEPDPDSEISKIVKFTLMNTRTDAGVKQQTGK